MENEDLFAENMKLAKEIFKVQEDFRFARKQWHHSTAEEAIEWSRFTKELEVEAEECQKYYWRKTEWKIP